MTNRTKICPTCGISFSYKIGKGNDRKHCGKDCRVKNQLEKRAIRFSLLGDCSVEGCNNKATRLNIGMCEKHHGRIRRNGNTKQRDIVGRYRTRTGYIKVLNREHILADSAGHVYEHRLIAYNSSNGVCGGCFWCGCDLSWDVAVVDHLNEVKDDNREDNLVISCNNCNRARGAVIPFLKRLKGSKAVNSFIECVIHHSEKTAREDGGFGR